VSIEGRPAEPPALSRARALASEPGLASNDSLVSAASDLIAWGAFDEGLRLASVLEERGLVAEAEEFYKSVDRQHGRRRQFDERFLVNAVATARNPDARTSALMFAADTLLRWGALDEADVAIARLKSNPATQAEAGALAMTSRQLRRSGILDALQTADPTEAGTLNRPHELLLARAKNPTDRVIVVFTGIEDRFWMSLQVLYHYLKKLDAHVIFVSDHSRDLFLNGLKSVGGGYKGLVNRIAALVRELDPRNVSFMASSAGGYVGLLIASEIKAQAFLGFGIKTILGTDPRLGLNKLEREAVARCSDPGILKDLRRFLADSGQPERVTLFAGDGAKLDIAHAEHLRGLRQVKIRYLSEYDHHNVVPGLIARGQFEDVLREFLVPAKNDASV
jgi:hypothetical protein